MEFHGGRSRTEAFPSLATITGWRVWERLTIGPFATLDSPDLRACAARLHGPGSQMAQAMRAWCCLITFQWCYDTNTVGYLPEVELQGLNAFTLLQIYAG